MASKSKSSGRLTLSQYLIARISQLSQPYVLGVPGDYSLGFLSEILAEHAEDQHKNPAWIGNANELNGAYAADGLARVLGPKRPSVLVTTMGVGELSAANGIAGSFSERIPVIHIVGTPATSAQSSGLLLHHTLGDHKFDAFGKMSRLITTAQVDFAVLHQEGRMQTESKDGAAISDDAARELDRVLEVCVRKALPVYIALPSDLVNFPLPTSAARRLTERPLNTSVEPNEQQAERYALRVITDKVRNAQCPVILVDACASRHDAVQETRDFVARTGLPVFATPMGKTTIDESDDNPQFGGVYIGSISSDEVKDVIENKADLVIAIGTLQSDFNTGSFSYRTRRESTIELHSDKACVAFATYEGVHMKGLLPKLTEALADAGGKRLAKTKELIRAARSLPSFLNQLPKPEDELASFSDKQIEQLGGKERITRELITQGYLWPRVGQFLREGDRVLSETGTSSFGMMEVRFPKNAQSISQVLWGSIGYALPATFGAALGMRELKRQGQDHGGRTILFIGDGSLQLTLQEVGTMIRYGLTPILFVLSNDGYEIERAIHGEEETYNDIAIYNHSKLLDLFSPPPGYKRPGNPSHAHDAQPSQTAYHAVHTKAELDALLKDEAFNRADKCTLVEVFMPRGDAPIALRRQAQLSSEANSY